MSEHDDLRWLRESIELSRSCPVSATAFSVGAVILGADGQVLSTGYSREGDPHVHAEEAALSKLPVDDRRLHEATIYSSLEPCSKRASRPRTCSELIIDAGIPRVVYAWREPVLFVDGEGDEKLREAEVTVVHLPQLADLVIEINAHLMGSGSK
ncbi:deaminase [Kribbella sp. DT2]|uniref:deaminase n=1 Tax=Kribbella sp. DT2 TaxID=3393427 RepID=UPI003CF499CB